MACKEGKYVDWARLKAKIDCGADFVITQLFFDNADFFEFRDHLQKHGVTVPIVPGIIPIMSTGQIKRFTALCGARLPAPLLASLAENCGDNDEAAQQFGIDYATRQCADLLRAGVPGLHFYTLNKAQHSTTQIVKALGIQSRSFWELESHRRKTDRHRIRRRSVKVGQVVPVCDGEGILSNPRTLRPTKPHAELRRQVQDALSYFAPSFAISPALLQQFRTRRTLAATRLTPARTMITRAKAGAKARTFRAGAPP